MAECIHQMEENTCSICLGKIDAILSRPKPGMGVKFRRGPQDVVFGPVIEAQFDGECPACGDDILFGEKITLTDDGWSHLRC